MKRENVLDVRKYELSLLFDLLGTIDFAQLVQIVLNYEL